MLDLLDQCNTIDDANKSDGSDTEDVLLFNKLTDLIINDFIKRQIFKSLQCISRNKRTPSVTVKGNVESLDIENDDEDKILQSYDGPRFSKGCNAFDAILSIHYCLIKIELDTIMPIEASNYGLRTTLILQHIMQQGKKIIFDEGQNRFQAINDLYINATEGTSLATRSNSNENSPAITNNSVVPMSNPSRRRLKTKRYAPIEQLKSVKKRNINKDRYTEEEVEL